ncbi:hypothetical protein D9M71_509160 [compost metagenome]
MNLDAAPRFTIAIRRLTVVANRERHRACPFAASVELYGSIGESIDAEAHHTLGKSRVEIKHFTLCPITLCTQIASLMPIVIAGKEVEMTVF